MVCEWFEHCHNLCRIPVDTYMLRKVFEDFGVTISRAAAVCTAKSMKVPDYLNVPFAHPFVRSYLYLCLLARDSHGYQSCTNRPTGFLSYLAV